MDASLMDQVREILEKYEVGNWNGFRGRDSLVLDGSSFSFHVSFTDGTSIFRIRNECISKESESGLFRAEYPDRSGRQTVVSGAASENGQGSQDQWLCVLCLSKGSDAEI